MSYRTAKCNYLHKHFRIRTYESFVFHIFINDTDVYINAKLCFYSTH